MGMYERIKDIAQERHISIAQLERQTGMSNGSISKWSKNAPSIDKAAIVARWLNVSVDYLLDGNEQTPEWATETDILELDKMLDSNVNMSYGGENLTEEEKQRVKDVLTGVFWEKLEKKKKHKN